MQSPCPIFYLMAITLDILKEKLINQVRIYLSDFPYYNRLIGDEENERDTIELAIDMSIDRFNNAEVPRTGFDFSNFPSLVIMIYGAVLELLQMKGILYSRNRLNYSDGGIQVAINDKATEYMQWARAMQQTYDRLVMDKKKELNAAACWGGIASEYASVDYWY